MGRMTALLMVTCMLLQARGSAPAQEKNITVLFKGNLTTRLNPTATDPITRSQPQEFTNFYGTEIELKYQFTNWNLAVSLSADYVSVSETRPLRVSFQTEVPTVDGYEAIPVEITGYFLIPASGPKVRIFMGGGGGVYFGHRHYSIAGVEAPVTSSRPGFGIHVLAGASYYFMSWLSMTAEMKFRDLQFHSTNAFSAAGIQYGDFYLKIPQTPFESTVQTDGIVFQLGVGVSF